MQYNMENYIDKMQSMLVRTRNVNLVVMKYIYV